MASCSDLEAAKELTLGLEKGSIIQLKGPVKVQEKWESCEYRLENWSSQILASQSDWERRMGKQICQELCNAGTYSKKPKGPTATTAVDGGSTNA